MNRTFKTYIPAAVAICIAVCGAAALLLLGPARAFGATSPDTSDDGSSASRMAASYLQRKVFDKAKQAIASPHSTSAPAACCTGSIRLKT